MTDLAIRERVAREVMGLTTQVIKNDFELVACWGAGGWCRDYLGAGGLIYPRHGEAMTWSEVPHYETDIAAAWQVVEKMRERGWSMDLTTRRHGGLATIEMFDADGTFATAEAPTAPMAICLAALAALEGK